MSESNLATFSMLYVEDEDELRQLAETIFQNLGVDIVTAENGLIAHTLLMERSFDVVVTDLFMPEMTGIKLLEISKFLQCNKDSVWILLTGDSSVPYKDYISSGFSEVFFKPFKAEMMYMTCMRLLETARKLTPAA